MICKRCGRDVTATGGFCTNCGTNAEEKKQANGLETPAEIARRNAHNSGTTMQQPVKKETPAPTDSRPVYSAPVYTPPVYPAPIYTQPAVYVVPAPIMPARKCRLAGVIVAIVALLVAIFTPMYDFYEGILGCLKYGEIRPMECIGVFGIILRWIAVFPAIFMVFLGLFRIRGAVVTFASIGLGFMVLAIAVCVANFGPGLVFDMEYTPVCIGAWLMVALDFTCILTS